MGVVDDSTDYVRAGERVRAVVEGLAQRRGITAEEYFAGVMRGEYPPVSAEGENGEAVGRPDGGANGQAGGEADLYAEIGRRMHAAILARAKELGVAPARFLNGVVGGKYPPVGLSEIDTSDLGVRIVVAP